MKTVEKIFKPYEKEGVSCMILTGRDLYDLESRPDKTTWTIFSSVAEYAYDKHSMVVVRYSLAHGIVVPYHLYEKSDCETIKKTLRTSEITNTKENNNASQEFVEILRGIIKLSESKNIRWANGNLMKFVFIIEYTSHMIPNATTTNQLMARELIFNIANSKNFLDMGNLFILSDVCEGKIDEQVRGKVKNLFLSYPTFDEKLEYISALHEKYPGSKSEISDVEIANLSSSTPNRSTDRVFRASHQNREKLDTRVLISQKTSDIANISEGTLSLLDTSRTNGVTLVGDNVRIPLDFLSKQADGLRNRDSSVSTNVLLAGAPGTAKTMMALKMAVSAGVPIFQLNSPKRSLVGETERLAELQSKIFSSTLPCVGFIDEITEAFPMSRTTNLDSGASDSVMGQLLTMLSDNSREGKTVLVSTTNCVSKIGSAMKDRFTIIPVIMPSLADLTKIICSIAREVSGGTATIDFDDPVIRQSANIFYDKHLMARRIRSVLKLELQNNQNLTPQVILNAARDACPLDETSWRSSVYADLDAINNCISQHYLPWYGNENNYSYPPYLTSVLDGNMQIDESKLVAEIQKLKPYVNV